MAVGWGVRVGLVCLQAPTHTRTISTSAAAMAPVLNARPEPGFLIAHMIAHRMEIVQERGWPSEERVERETGFEPATTCLEG
ncbi:MAG: hypothetical protein ABIG98_06980, partial [Chloroflexota bacterium]